MALMWMLRIKRVKYPLLRYCVYDGMPNTVSEVDQYLSIVGSNLISRFNF
jgi:hypothetical protein